jgi:hypothetical protein
LAKIEPKFDINHPSLRSIPAKAGIQAFILPLRKGDQGGFYQFHPSRMGKDGDDLLLRAPSITFTLNDAIGKWHGGLVNIDLV